MNNLLYAWEIFFQNLETKKILVFMETFPGLLASDLLLITFFFILALVNVVFEIEFITISESHAW